MPSNPIKKLIESYYKEIFGYCCVRLNGDVQGAEDCTQEVMLVLHKKANQLDLSRDIRPWLYSVADKEIKTYYRKYKAFETCNNDYLNNMQESSENPFTASILDILNEEDYELAQSYWQGEDKKKIAEKHSISLEALYTKISRIKKKLKNAHK